MNINLTKYTENHQTYGDITHISFLAAEESPPTVNVIKGYMFLHRCLMDATPGLKMKTRETAVGDVIRYAHLLRALSM